MKTRKLIRALAPPTARRFRPNRPDFTSEEGIARRLNENRGQGIGPDYLTWLRVPEFGSSGYRRMVWSPRLGRIVHLLSDLEWRTFLYAEFNRNIIDIRENYPLARERTRAIAKQLGVRHPAPDGTDIVMTCDLYLTEQTPVGRRHVAWTVKDEKELHDPRVLEKLKIEEAYHQSEDVPVQFRIMTEHSVPDTLIENLEFVRGTLHPGAMDDYPAQLLADIDGRMRPLLATAPLGVLCDACDEHLHLAPGTTVRAARYLIAARRWPVDFNHPITMHTTLTLEIAS